MNEHQVRNASDSRDFVISQSTKFFRKREAVLKRSTFFRDGPDAVLSGLITEDAVDDFNLAALVDIPSNISPSGNANSNLKGKSHTPLKSKPSDQESKPSNLTKQKSEVSVGLRKKLEVIKKLEGVVQQIIDLDDEFYAKIGLCIESEVRKYNLQEPQIMETKQRILSAMLSNSMPKIFKRHGN